MGRTRATWNGLGVEIDWTYDAPGDAPPSTEIDHVELTGVEDATSFEGWLYEADANNLPRWWGCIVHEEEARNALREAGFCSDGSVIERDLVRARILPGTTADVVRDIHVVALAERAWADILDRFADEIETDTELIDNASEDRNRG